MQVNRLRSAYSQGPISEATSAYCTMNVHYDIETIIFDSGQMLIFV